MIASLFVIILSSFLIVSALASKLPYDLGVEVGVQSSSQLSPENLQKVLNGVDNGNKESIYYYALLKLYGISLTRDETVAAQHFKLAADMGHVEAMTAFGVMLMNGVGIPLDLAAAAFWFRKGIMMNDVNAPWLLAK